MSGSAVRSPITLPGATGCPAGGSCAMTSAPPRSASPSLTSALSPSPSAVSVASVTVPPRSDGTATIRCSWVVGVPSSPVVDTSLIVLPPVRVRAPIVAIAADATPVQPSLARLRRLARAASDATGDLASTSKLPSPSSRSFMSAMPSPRGRRRLAASRPEQVGLLPWRAWPPPSPAELPSHRQPVPQ